MTVQGIIVWSSVVTVQRASRPVIESRSEKRNFSFPPKLNDLPLGQFAGASMHPARTCPFQARHYLVPFRTRKVLCPHAARRDANGSNP